MMFHLEQIYGTGFIVVLNGRQAVSVYLAV